MTSNFLLIEEDHPHVCLCGQCAFQASRKKSKLVLDNFSLILWRLDVHSWVYEHNSGKKLFTTHSHTGQSKRTIYSTDTSIETALPE